MRITEQIRSRRFNQYTYLMLAQKSRIDIKSKCLGENMNEWPAIDRLLLLDNKLSYLFTLRLYQRSEIVIPV